MLPIALLAALLPRPAAVQQDGPSAWHALPWPALVRPSPHAAARGVPRLDGVYARAWSARVDAPREAPPVSPALVRELCAETLLARGMSVELAPTSSALYVRGAPDAIEAVRATLRTIEDAVAPIVLEVALVAGEASDGAADQARRTIELRSGEHAAIDEREPHAFLGEWMADVASDSGVADPEPWIAATGRRVDLWAAWLPSRDAIVIDGLLDLSELTSLESLDPQTPDLGAIELPSVRCAQVAFSDVIAAGEELVVRVEGAPLAAPDWRLAIRLVAPAPPAAAAGDWIAHDLAFAARPAWDLAPVDAGFALELGERGAAHEPLASFSPSMLADMAQRPALAKRPPVFSDRLLFLPSGDRALADAARELIGAAASVARATSRVRVTHGALRAELPVRATRVARVVAGEERRALVDYQTELAPQIWMPSPRLHRLFDGVAIEGELEGSGAGAAWSASAWIASTTGMRTLGRDALGLGRIDLPTRSSRANAARARAGQGVVEILPAGGESSALQIEVGLH